MAALAGAPGCAADPDAPSDGTVGERQGGWLAQQIMGTRVYGADGEAIGESADIVVGSDDRVEAIIVGAGAVGDLGDVLCPGIGSTSRPAPRA